MKTICWFLTTWDEPGLPPASWIFPVLLFVFVAFNVPPGVFGESASPNLFSNGDLNLATSWSGEACDTSQEVSLLVVPTSAPSVRDFPARCHPNDSHHEVIWTFGHVSSARSVSELASMLARAVSGSPPPPATPSLTILLPLQIKRD